MLGKKNAVEVIVDIFFLFVLFLFGGSTLMLMWQGLYYNPLCHVLPLSVLVLAVFSVILQYWRGLRDSSKKIIGIFNRLIFVWIVFDALLYSSPWYGYPLFPPWNNIYDIDICLSVSWVTIETGFLKLFWCFFFGTIIGFAIPFITKFSLWLVKLLYQKIVYPIKKSDDLSLSSDLIAIPENSVLDLNTQSFTKFLGRTIYFYVFVAPIIFNLLGVTVEWAYFEVWAEPYFSYYATFLLIPLLVGIGHFIESMNLTKSPTSGDGLSETYFGTLLRISLLTGIFTCGTVMSLLLTEQLPIDRILLYTIRFYLPLVGTSMPIFAILTNRKLGKNMFNLRYSAVIGGLFILVFTSWLILAQNVPRFILIPVVLLSCAWLLISLDNWFNEETKDFSKFSWVWRILIISLFVSILFLSVIYSSCASYDWMLFSIAVFYFTMILIGIKK